LLWISHRWDEIVKLTDDIYELSPNEKEIGILRKKASKQLSINIDLDGDSQVKDLESDLHSSLIGTLLAHQKSQYLTQAKINIVQNFTKD